MSHVAEDWEQKLANTNQKKTTSSVRGLYDEWSSDYDESLDEWGYEAPEKCANLLEQHAFLNDQSLRTLKILDVGSGTGLVAEALSVLCRFSDSKIYAMDLSAKSLDIASQKNIYHKLDCHSFNETPYQYADNTFDAITCVGALTYCNNFPGVFKEWIRISKPGAILVMTHRADLMAKDKTYFDGMQASLQWKQLDHIKGQPYLPGNSNFKDNVLVDYYVARNIKKSSKL